MATLFRELPGPAEPTRIQIVATTKIAANLLFCRTARDARLCRRSGREYAHLYRTRFHGQLAGNRSFEQGRSWPGAQLLAALNTVPGHGGRPALAVAT